MRDKKQFLRIGVVALALLVGRSAVADNSKISPDLLPLLSNPSNQVAVIVQYNTTPPCTSGGLLGGLLCTGLNLLGDVVHVVFSLINAVSATVTAGDVLNLSNQSNVSYISLDRTLGASLDYSTAAANAPVAWSAGLEGTGVGIAVIDSGIYSHPDLGSRVVYRQSFIGGTKYDDFGHGTHVAGIIGGSGKSSNLPGSPHVLKGVAPNANLLDLRVLNAQGVSNDSVVISAIQQAVSLKSKYNVRVINLSLGRPFYESCSRDPLCQAVEAAWKSGITVVVAAGNLGRNGYATVLSPGNSPHAITVGAMKTEGTYARTDDLVASYSSKGPTYIDLTAKPDLVAPGNLVVSLRDPGSTLEQEYPANIVAPTYYGAASTASSQYFRLSGTSMATPVVSGAAALMLQKDPTLTPDAIKARLMKTASKAFPVSSTATDPTTGKTYVSTYDLFTIGAGYLDISAALADYESVSHSAISPTVTYSPLTSAGSLLFTPSMLWNSSVAWSTNAVWGSAVVGSGNTIWDAAAIWSTNPTWGTAIAWGTSGNSATAIAWGTNGTSGTAIAWGTSGSGEK